MSNLEIAKSKLVGDNTCVLVKDETIYVSTKTGIAPMMEFIAEDVDLKGFSVADRIVGKAAAMLFVKAGIVEVFSKVISEPAVEYLKKYDVKVSFDTLTERIINRAGTGLCPMEETVKDVSGFEEGYKLLKAKVEELKKKDYVK